MTTEEERHSLHAVLNGEPTSEKQDTFIKNTIQDYIEKVKKVKKVRKVYPEPLERCDDYDELKEIYNRLT